jgi:hypothetical protein
MPPRGAHRSSSRGPELIQTLKGHRQDIAGNGIGLGSPSPVSIKVTLLVVLPPRINI